MADHKPIIPFIHNAEGGYVNDPLDAGGETMQGITYAVWCSIFGPNCHARFMRMAPEDWETIFKHNYWDAILGDQIKSQRIANVVVDWVWGSGKFYPERHIQHILNTLFFAHIGEDGNFGSASINSINLTDEQHLYDGIIADRFTYLDTIVQNSIAEVTKKKGRALTPHEILTETQGKFLLGWKNRMNNLIEFNKNLA